MNETTQGVRYKVLETAKAIYANATIHGATMDDVAKAAGIGRATLYRHFKGRDELLLAVIETEAVAIAQRVEKKIRKISSPGEYIIEGMLN